MDGNARFLFNGRSVVKGVAGHFLLDESAKDAMWHSLPDPAIGFKPLTSCGVVSSDLVVVKSAIACEGAAFDSRSLSCKLNRSYVDAAVPGGESHRVAARDCKGVEMCCCACRLSKPIDTNFKGHLSQE